MEALLILGGLLLILAGFVWLVSQAFATSLFWGLGSLLPPITLAFVFRHWRVARKTLLLAGLGCIPLVVGLSLLANRDADRLVAIFNLSWLPSQVQPELHISLRGQLNGRSFAPQQGELINGTLTLREGQGFFARQEVSIRLADVPPGALSVDVLPGDVQGVPEVSIAWLAAEQELPETRRLESGYTLHLDLRPLPPNRLQGDFHLVLPPQYQTSLNGTVELYTDRLRYRDGKVDRNHDSVDTVAYVIEDYLQRRHASREVRLQPLPKANPLSGDPQLQVQALVDGQLRDFTLRVAKNTRGWHVQGDEFPPLPAASKPLAQSAVATTALAVTEPEPAAVPSSSLDRRVRFSMERLLRNPAPYQHLLVRAHTERGGVAEGRFGGLDGEGRLIIRRVLRGPGEAAYNLAAGEIVLLELMEP